MEARKHPSQNSVNNFLQRFLSCPDFSDQNYDTA